MRLNRILMMAGLGIAASAASAGDTYNITLDGLNFVYEGQSNMDIDLTINVGDTVEWLWVAGFHNVVSGEQGEPSEGLLFRSGDPTGAAGTMFSYTFTETGLVDYHCEIHSGIGMRSQVNVIPAPGALALLAPAGLIAVRRRR